MVETDKIRNFCIIAHIDHGKSTLADRLLEKTGTIAKRDMKSQILDKMDLEQEKGITIKLAPVRMSWKDYSLNLIDTPGHVDFSYEVSRSLAACEGALVVVDAAQGVQAQTLANVQMARAANLKLLAVINKIDLPAAEPDKVRQQIKTMLKIEKEPLVISAKTGQGVEQVLRAIVKDLPPPKKQDSSRARALIFDSYYDDYRGVVLYVRLMSGQIARHGQLLMMAGKVKAQAVEVGYLSPQPVPCQLLNTGEIGYIVTNLKTTAQARAGDTVTLQEDPASQPLPGYRPAKVFIFAGLFPADAGSFAALRKALEKLSLSDSTLLCEAENSPVLGHGFRCGFLGLLHLEITVERLKREYRLNLIVSNPSTSYEVLLTNQEEMTLKSASDLPEAQRIAEIREPWVKGEIICPPEKLGAVMQLLIKARGQVETTEYAERMAILSFEAPVANLLTDFYDQLKSITSGYGSLNYELDDYRSQDLVRLDFYVAGEMVGALSVICHRQEAQALGRQVVSKLKNIIPRQQFKVSLQAALGGKFIARADLPGFRKDVTAKLYGGDVTRRKKLLEKQKKGKARMKKIGRVELPPATFTVLLQKDQTEK